MFPTSGYFKGLTCPYFASGLCERPYCHFRHVKPPSKPEEKEVSVHRSLSHLDNGHTAPTPPPGSADAAKTSPFLFMVGSAITQVRRETERTEKHTHAYTTEKTSTAKYTVHDTSGLTYKPTAKYTLDTDTAKYRLDNDPAKYRLAAPKYPSTNSSSNASAAKPWHKPAEVTVEKPSYPEFAYNTAAASKHTNAKPSMPEYNPTPIRVLKLQAERQKQAKKCKYSMDNGTADNEYDPSTNFSSTSGYDPLNSGTSYTPRASAKIQRETVQDIPMEDEIEAAFSDEDDEVSAPVIEPIMSEDEIEAPPIEPHSPDLSIFHTKDFEMKESNGMDDQGNGSTINHQTSENKQDCVGENNKTKTSDSLNGLNKENAARQNNQISKSQSSHKSSGSSKNKHDSSKSHSKSSSSKSSSSKSSSSKSSSSKSSSSKSSSSSSKSKDSKSSSSSSRRSSSDDHKHSSHKSGHSKSSSSGSSKSSSSKVSSSSSSKSSSSSSKHKHSSGSKSSSKTEVHIKKENCSSHKSSSHRDESGHSSHRSSGNKTRKIKPDPDGKKTDAGQIRIKADPDAVMERVTKIKKEKDDGDKKKDVSTADLFGDDSDGDDIVVTKVKLPGEESPHSLVSISDDSDDDDDANDIGWDYVDDELAKEFETDFTEDDLQNNHSHDHQEDFEDNFYSQKSAAQKRNADAQAFSLGKKRVARASQQDIESQRKLPAPRPGSRPTPSQVMLNRYKEMQKRASEQMTAGKPDSVAGKRRLSNHNNPLLSKSPRISFANRSVTHASPTDTDDTEPTTAGMLPKTGSSKTANRKAHVPPKAVIKRPTIPAEIGSKVPSNIRQTYLNKIIDECLKIYPDEANAFERALEEERAVYGRSSNKNIYLNCTVNTIKRLRTEAGSLSPTKTDGGARNPKTLSHDFVLGGSKAANTGFTVRRSGGPVKQKTSFTDVEIYKLMQVYVINEEQLKENGFPRPHDNKAGDAVIYREDNRARSKIANEKICIRCGKRFTVLPNGKYATEEECVYHFGKAWKKKIAGAWETRYNCCQSDLDVKGCQVCKMHVHEDNKRGDMSGYVTTLPCSPPPDGDYGVYALDCEMVYTIGGCELARVTVIGADLKPIVERLVKPQHPVIDYNTRFSGLTAEDLVGVTTTLQDVQAVLLSLFSDNTILIGHSLESDFVALKLIHSTVVDTSVVFPHRLGLPYKRALRTLMGEYLQRIIQNDVGGHDSLEDAVACMDLMTWKLKEDVKRLQRRS